MIATKATEESRTTYVYHFTELTKILEDFVFSDMSSIFDDEF